MVSRYSRQEALPAVGKDGQAKLLKAKVTIVGCGALGTHAAELLLRAGVRHLVLIDDDKVDLSNLQRQSLYIEADIGKIKVEALRTHLISIDSKADITIHDARLSEDNLVLLSGIVLDCTDNIESRYLIDEGCAKRDLVWVHAACVGRWGEVKVFTPGKPRYKDVFPDKTTPESCVDAGVLNHTVSMTASVQVGECVKLILGKPHTEELIRINAWEFSIEKVRVS